MMIRRINLPGTGIETSAIGFGCASLGSRISPKAGLRSLELAYEAGVSWFDVAPAYGAGQAEEILGPFLKGRRDKVNICSKVGIVPPRGNALLRSVYGVTRPAISMLGGLRRRFRKVSATRNRVVELNSAMIHTSIEQSLQRLDTDYLDVFFLHNPAPEYLDRDDVQKALGDIVASGKARHVGIAGTYETALRLPQGDNLFNVVQFADRPEQARVATYRASRPRPVSILTHSILGVGGSHDALMKIMADNPVAQTRLREAGYEGALSEATAALLIDSALWSNAQGVVLMSMFSQKHMSTNTARANIPPTIDSVNLLKSLVSAS